MGATNQKTLAVVVIVIIIGAAAVGTAYFLSTGTPTVQPIRIGILEPLTGSLALPGQGSLAGFQVALQQINEAGGILGRPVVLFVEDTEGNPEKAASAATKLITVNNVDFLLGTIGSAECLQVAEVAAEYHKIYISTNPTTNGFTQLVIDDYDTYKYLFRTQWNATQWFYAWFTGIVDLFPDIDSMCLISEDLLWAREGSQILANYCLDAGFDYHELLFTPGATEFSAEIAQIQVWDPDIVLSSLLYGSSLGLNKQWWALKPDIIYFAAGGLLSYPTTVEELGANNTDYMISYNSFWNVSMTEKSHDYFNAFLQFSGKEPFGADVPAYDGLTILAAAIQAAGTIETGAVIQALEDGTFTGARGIYTFTPYHQADYLPGLMLEWMSTRPTVIWPTELATGTYQQAPWLTAP